MYLFYLSKGLKAKVSNYNFLSQKENHQLLLFNIFPKLLWIINIMWEKAFELLLEG